MERVRSSDGEVVPEPISSYGLVGDTRTAALSSAAGSIDWLCLPSFSGDPIFGRLVGGDDAGCFAVSPAEPGARVVSRVYRAGSTLLETTWATDRGEITLCEGMVADVVGGLLPDHLLVRRVESHNAPARLRVYFDPRRGIRRRRPRVERRPGAVVCSWGPLAIAVHATSGEVLVGRATEILVEPGRPWTCALSAAYRAPLIYVDPEEAWAAVLRDEVVWRRWSKELDVDGEFREPVARSLIILRLLTYSPSGAPVAAPTTSLPEMLGGSRNWDYRYAWPRDASIGIGAFVGVGRADVAASFMSWLQHATRLDRPRLPALLTLHGGHVPAEREAPEWPGYAGSIPVRFGNSAAGQHQLDGYGWVIDAAHVFVVGGNRLNRDAWRAICAFADYVADSWRAPDQGIWEVRDEPKHYVHSKLMAWLGLDRALRLAAIYPVRASRRARWASEREALARDVNEHGFDAVRSTFIRSYGSTDLDAALLVVPLLGFADPVSEPIVGTVDAIRRELSAGGPLLYRYPPQADGLTGREGAFLPCSFWLVQALAMTGRVDAAVEIFQQLLTYGGPLGLFPEEIDPITHTALGNFPQALTHAALIQAALAIRDATR